MINTKEQIIKYFESGIKNIKDFKIGIEHEKFLFNNKDNKRVNYSKIKEMFAALLEFGWNPILEKHGEFQMYYYAHHLGKNQNQRDKYKDHEYYNDALQFCEKWDQVSFDPDYKSMTLEDFAPMIKRIFARKPYSLL